ncbi:hypothetical protein NL676_004118 [Syzygium grande]|nr:hypothetical protein NL676_004118 [Syzygium grande]
MAAGAQILYQPRPKGLESELSPSLCIHCCRCRYANSSSTPASSTIVVDNLSVYMQITDEASISVDCDISDRSFQLFRDCCLATCLRNWSVEALATAALVQAIREAQEPRTLQMISRIRYF